jgi:hypothetical protein
VNSIYIYPTYCFLLCFDLCSILESQYKFLGFIINRIYKPIRKKVRPVDLSETIGKALSGNQK